MYGEEKFTLHPTFRHLYEQTQTLFDKESWQGLPASLDGIGPIRHVDFARNEGEKRTGTTRVFADLPAKEGAPHTLELRFHPLTGKVGWWWHHGNGASGSSETTATEMLWPYYLPMQLAMFHVAELLDAGEPERQFASWEIRRFLLGKPAGVGYREFTKTGARTIAKMFRGAPALDPVPQIENEDWYAYGRIKPYHEDEREPLELWIGQTVWLPGGKEHPGIAAFLDDMLIIEIADKGRGEATIRRWPGSTLHGLSSTGDRRFFPIKEKFAKHLWTFVTPELESSYHVLKRLRVTVTPESKEP